MDTSIRERAIAEYHEMLARDESLTAELFSRLKDAMSHARLLYGQREIGVSLRPHFLEREQYELLAFSAHHLTRAFDTIAEALLADPGRMIQIGLREREQRLALIDPGFPHSTITTRLDAFAYGDEIKYVEYNAENPSSLPDQPALNQILFEVPAMQLFAERYRLRQFHAVAALLDSLLATWKEWGGRGAPNIAILDWADLPTEHEFILLRNYFVSHGVPAIICTPDELDYAGGKLRRGDFPIDLVYKRVIIHEFLERYDDGHPLIEAYRNHDVCLVNPFRCKLVHKKASFEMLSDEANKHWFSAQQQDVIRACIPWTRRVFERKTVHQDQPVDLLPHLRKHRASFLLKPNDDYGGRGIFFGADCSESEWDNRLAIALAGDYVVQERLDLHLEDFPIFNKDEWHIQPMYVDTNPFVFRNRVEGAMVRLSDTPIVNVTSGGGETGLFVIESERSQ